MAQLALMLLLSPLPGPSKAQQNRPKQKKAPEARTEQEARIPQQRLTQILLLLPHIIICSHVAQPQPQQRCIAFAPPHAHEKKLLEDQRCRQERGGGRGDQGRRRRCAATTSGCHDKAGRVREAGGAGGIGHLVWSASSDVVRHG